MLNELIKLKKQSTAIYPNRIKDKEKVESLLQLWEFGTPNVLFLTKSKSPVFKGYVRVVYGDHGPYVEFELTNLISKNIIRKFNNVVSNGSYYEWLTIADDSGIKIYYQLRDVHNLPNPPHPGYHGNRKEGYADYRPNYYYVSPYEMIIVKG
jgi:hypothetical protein